MDEDDLERTLQRMARQIVELMDPDDQSGRQFALVGMQTRGVHLAQRLKTIIGDVDDVDLALGVLDVTMYRDDVRQRLRQRVVRATRIPFDVTGRHLVLIDDVVYTGRTVRAAMDALMDIGRPASIRLLTLVDRGLRELPIRADFIGRTVPTIAGEEIRVRLSECDSQEGVWLVERRAVTPTP